MPVDRVPDRRVRCVGGVYTHSLTHGQDRRCDRRDRYVGGVDRHTHSLSHTHTNRQTDRPTHRQTDTHG